MGAVAKIVGVALKKEKAEKHIKPKLIALAADAGIELKLIDPDQSLESQEPFSVLLHKIRDAGESIYQSSHSFTCFKQASFEDVPTSIAVFPLSCVLLSFSCHPKLFTRGIRTKETKLQM